MPAVGLGRGAAHVVAGGGAPAFYPTDVAGCVEFWDASFAADMVLSRSDVISWAGRLGAHSFSDDGNSAQRPSVLTAELNGTDVVQFNGTTDWLLSTYTPPRPSVQNVWIFGVWRLDAITSWDTLWNCGGSGAYLMAAYTNGTGATVVNTNGTTLNNAGLGSTGTWGRTAVRYTGVPSSDSTLFLATEVTGSLSNSVPAAAVAVGSRHGAATTFSASSLSAFGIWLGEPSAPDRALIDGWVTSTRGAGLV